MLRDGTKSFHEMNTATVRVALNYSIQPVHDEVDYASHHANFAKVEFIANGILLY